MIPYGRQDISAEDIKSVIKVLKSDYLTQGPLSNIFEKKLSKYTNSKYVTSSNSGTAALHISCLALGLRKGDLVWTSPNSFIASANCAEYCNANVDFVDIDYSTGNMSVDALEEKIAKFKKKNKLPKILIPVHFAGNPTDQKKIYNLAKNNGIKIIEDASHSLGAINYKEHVGSSKYSDITVFSFHPVKSITSAEGGAATTNSKKIFELLKQYKIHGVIQKNYQYHNSYCSYYQNALGYNYRFNEIQSALAISQLNRIKYFIKERNKLADYYDKVFKNTNISFLDKNKNNKSSNHLYVVRPKNLSKEFTNIKSIPFLKKKGIGVNCHYFPIHLQPYYRKKGFKLGDFPNAEKHGKYSVSIPLYVGLKSNQQKKVINTLFEFYNK